MPDTNVKKFLDQSGTSYLWTKIKSKLDDKADKTTVSGIADRVTTLEGSSSSLGERLTTAETTIANHTTAIGTKASQSDLDTVSGKVTTLIGSDTNKSVRTIANEELAAQLIASPADEALDTLQEIAQWIQDHPGDASAMNSAISALQAKTELGTNANNEEYATVKAYVEAYVAAQLEASDLSQYASASDLDALEALVGNTAVATQISNAITALDLANTYDSKGSATTAENNAKNYADGLASNYATAAQGAKADTALQSADIIGLTSTEIDAAIASASSGS